MAYGGVAGMTTAHAFSYAGFWLRFVALLIDGFLLSSALLVVFIPFVFMTGIFGELQYAASHPADHNPAAAAGVFFAFGLLAILAVTLHWLYYGYLESGAKQATWGKQILGIYVTDLSGNRVSFGRASGRFFARFITGMIPFAIGYIMAGFTERRQALHDMIAGSLVVRR